MIPGETKAVAEAMTALWKSELPATIRVLSALRDETRDYRPDPKSRSAWDLAVHLATADLWFLESAERGVFQFDPAAAKQAEAQFSKASDIVAFYEDKIPGVILRLRSLSAEQLAVEVDFFGMMKLSRAAWIGFANNHSIHHRGQLSAYLRGLGAKVPDIYGPSGDAEPRTK
ncbi:MAG: DinB family protein [Gemmatimonadales bacterium]